ncbi:hypothetical protein L208DRAFT_1504662 [Tricholoma matsutake]|nr:hypothetical protein L208DRAFT_1504662 [Tricholoma matsutake 945]
MDRFREAGNSQAWDMGPEGQHFENPLTQSKRFKPMLDGGDSATVQDISKADPDDIMEEGSECGASEDGEAIDEHELNEHVVVAKWDEAETDWESDEGKLVDEPQRGLV